MRRYYLHQLKYILVVLAVLAAGILAYHTGLYYLAKQGMEYRFAIEAIYRILALSGVLILGGMILRLFAIWLRNFHRIVLSAFAALLFTVYSLGSFAFLFANYGGWILKEPTDQQMPDGNLVVTVPTDEGNDYYYAEPRYGIARKPFTWNPERTAQSLSKLYGVPFTADESSAEDVVYLCDSYPMLKTRVYAIGVSQDAYFDDDFRALLTQQSLIDAWESHFKNGEDMIYYNWGTTLEPRVVGALCVYYTRRVQHAQDIASFVRDEIGNSDRWKQFDGCLYVIIKDESADNADYVCRIPFGQDEKQYEDADEVLSLIDETYPDEEDSKKDAVADSPAGNSELPADTVQDSAASSGDTQAESALTRAQQHVRDGYRQLYQDYFVGDNYSFIEDADPGGNSRVILFENMDYVYYLQFRQDTDDKTGGEYGYYEVKKCSDGAWTSDDAVLLDVYRYVYDTAQTADTGDTSW